MVVAVLKISVPCESGCKRGFTENIVTTKGQQFGTQCLIKRPYYRVPREAAVQRETSGAARMVGRGSGFTYSY